MQPGDEGIHDESGAAHAAHQQEQELSIVPEDLQAALGDGGEHEAQDAKGSELDDPADNLRDHVREVAEDLDSPLRSQQFQGEAQDDGPEQDADVIGLRERLDGVHHHVRQERQEHVGQAAGRAAAGLGSLQRNRDREQETRHHREDCGAQRGDQIQEDDRAEAGAQAALRLGNGRGDKQRHQHRGDSLQGAHEHLPQNPNRLPLRAQEPQHGADHQADHDSQHQRTVGPLLQEGRKLAHTLQGTKKGLKWQEITIFVKSTKTV